MRTNRTNHGCYSSFLLAVVLTAAAAIENPGLAEDTPASNEQPASDGSGELVLQEVVVTAQKRSENLQNVPITVSAFSAKTLATSNITSTADLPMLTPGFEQGAQFGISQPFLRGIGTIATSPGIESPIALYIDGVYDSSMSGAILALNNVQQIEVDKGPQGTLFGRNATGGAIQVTTLDPTQRLEGDASLTYGDYRTAGADFYVSGGITPSLAANLAAYFSDQMQGYGRNAFDGREVNWTRDAAVRNKWLLTPSSVTQIKLTLDYEQTDFSSPYIPAPGTTPFDGAPYTGPREGMNGYFAPYGLIQQGGASLQVKHEFGFATLSSLTAYRRLYMRSIFDGSLIPDYTYDLNIDITQPQWQWSQEFQLTSPGEGRLRWVTGVYLYYADARYAPVEIDGGYVPNILGLSLFDAYSDQKDYSAAGYAQATERVAEDTHLTLGARYTFERRNEQTGEFLGILGVPGVSGAEDAGRHAIFNVPTWRISLDHQFSGKYLTYVSYNRGFKSGGFNDDLVPATEFGPEKLDDYEIGLKSQVLNDRVRVNVAGFYYDYKNLQAVRYPEGLNEVYNAPSARLYGVDLDANVLITSQLTLSGGVEALHSRYVDFPNAWISVPVPGGGTNFNVGSVDGNELPMAPNLTANVSASYSVYTTRGELQLTGTYAYNSGWYGEPDNVLHQGHYDLVNAQVAWSLPDALTTIRLWGKNLTNAFYTTLLGSASQGDVSVYAPPRTYGVTVERRF